MMRKKKTRTTAIVALGIASMVALAGAAQAESGSAIGPKEVMVGAYQIADPVPSGFSSWDGLVKVQAELDTVADRVISVSRNEVNNGYSSLAVSDREGKLSIYWHGGISPAVQEVLRSMPPGITYEIKPAAYSAIEIMDAMGALEKNTSYGTSRIVMLAPQPDGSGIVATATGDLDAIRNAPAIKDSSVPVTVEAGSDIQPTNAPAFNIYTRDSDVNPYWGGARIYGNGGCSTGFAAKDITTGNPVMITAAHCVTVGDPVRIGDTVPLQLGPNGQLNWHEVGTAYFKQPDHDNAVVSMPGGPAIYRGPVGSWDSSPVNGMAGSHVGDWNCTGGAFSGEHCGIQTYLVNATAIDKNGKPYEHNLSVAKQWQGSIAVAGGDSGGPVFSATLGPGVTARGIISGGMNLVSCDSVESPVKLDACYSDVIFSPISYALDSNMVTLATQ